MPLYHITLPKVIPAFLFSNLDGNVHDGIRNNLEDAYRQVKKDAYNQDETPIAALSDHFVRDLGKSIQSKSLIKMFRPVVDNYVKIEPKPRLADLPQPQTEPRRLEQRVEDPQLKLF